MNRSSGVILCYRNLGSGSSRYLRRWLSSEHWVRLFGLRGVSKLTSFPGCFTANAIFGFDYYGAGEVFLTAGIYVSLLANSIVCPALLTLLWQARKQTQSLGVGSALVNSSHERDPYTRLMGILAESALPPMVLGFLHLGLNFGIGFRTIAINVLWLSLTVRIRLNYPVFCSCSSGVYRFWPRRL